MNQEAATKPIQIQGMLHETVCKPKISFWYFADITDFHQIAPGFDDCQELN